MTAPTDQATTSATMPRHRRDGTAPSETEPALPLQARSSQPWDRAGADIGGLIRPMLEALATLADMDATYLTVFDWERRQQEVRFVFAAGRTQIQEGQRLPLPEDVSEEAFPGVTRSPLTLDHHAQPDSLVARRLGLKTFVSVPVTAAKAAEVHSRALSPAGIDLGAMVGEIARAFDGLDTTHHVVAEVSGPLRAFADPTAVYQILGHLIDNAIKYSPDGGLITVRAADAAGSISIEVIDQGIGLPPAADVFEAFRRGAPQDQRTPGGSDSACTLYEPSSRR